MNQLRFLSRLSGILLVLVWASALYAEKWAVLPVRTLALSANTSTSGPVLYPDERNNALHLGRFVYMYLRFSQMHNLIPPSKTELAYRKLGIRSHSRLSKTRLRDLARKLDADNLLHISVTRAANEFQIESNVYYAYSDQIADKIVSRHQNLWMALGRHIHERFSTIEQISDLQTSTDRPFMLLADASGANHQELSVLRSLLPVLDIEYSAACAVDADGNLSYSKMQDHPEGIVSFLRNLRTGGGIEQPGRFVKLAECGNRLNPYRGTLSDKPYVVLLVSSSETAENRLRLKAQLRKLSSTADVLIFGSGFLDNEQHAFWVKTANELNQTGSVSYEDILYRVQVGLKNGESWNIFKKGHQLIESQSEIPAKTEKGIIVPAHKRSSFKPGNLLSIYRDLSKNTVISSSAVDIRLQKPLHSFLSVNSSSVSTSTQELRVLLEIQNKPFWISLPKSAVFSRSGRQLIKENQSAYFLLQLLPSKHGMPFRNDGRYAALFTNGADVSRMPLLDITRYLKNPRNWLNRSINGSSLYMVHGKVKLIRVTEKDISDY